eukprot:1147569-Pelagomonas_calceolata.AAC.2
MPATLSSNDHWMHVQRSGTCRRGILSTWRPPVCHQLSDLNCHTLPLFLPHHLLLLVNDGRLRGKRGNCTAMLRVWKQGSACAARIARAWKQA